MTFHKIYGNAKRGIGVRFYTNGSTWDYSSYVLEDGEAVDSLSEDAGPFESQARAQEASYNEAELWCLDEGIDMEDQS